MSAALVGERVWQVIREGADQMGVFSHGYTYSGHPLGAAAANAVLTIVERENLAANAEAVGEHLRSRLRALLQEHPHVAEIRGVGMLAAIEFAADPKERLRFDPSEKVGARISAAARERGVIARAMPHGDILGFAPPLVLTMAEADEIATVAAAAVKTVLPC
jgi:L-2,4-diaminobutyrate transaminase